MEEKKQIKISLKTAVLLFLILLIVVAIALFLLLNNNKRKLKNDIIKSTNSGDYKEVSVDGEIYYERLSKILGKDNIIKIDFRQKIKSIVL